MVRLLARCADARRARRMRVHATMTRLQDDCERFDRAGGYCIEGKDCTCEPPHATDARLCECSYGLAGGFRVHDCDCPVHGPMPRNIDPRVHEGKFDQFYVENEPQAAGTRVDEEYLPDQDTCSHRMWRRSFDILTCTRCAAVIGYAGPEGGRE